MRSGSVDYVSLLHEKTGQGVAKVVINRPKVLNAIDYPTLVELRDVMTEIARDPDSRIVIITGSGDKAFCVGADRNELKRHQGDTDRARVYEEAGRAVCNLIYDLGKPTLCAINGYAFGLGLQIALACTFRIIASGVQMGLPEINMGFFPSMGATQRLPRLIGESKAIEMITTGEPIDAAEAHRLGLANRVVPPGELNETAEAFAVAVAQKNPSAVALAIDAIRHEKTLSLEQGLAYEARLSKACRQGSGCGDNKGKGT